MAGPGRPSKFTPTIKAAIIASLEQGNYQEVAAAQAGVSRTTLGKWLTRGRAEGEGEYYDFLQAVEQAKAKAEGDALNIIRNAALNGTWQAAAWFLERSKPERWRLRTTTEVADADEGGRVQGDDARDKVSAIIDELAAQRAKRQEG